MGFSIFVPLFYRLFMKEIFVYNLLLIGGRGIGQVMFQESTVTGILFLIAVFINSRTAAIYAILGALLPIPIAILLEV